MLDRSGAGELDSEQLKIEWYKLATEFGFGVREHFSTFSMNGLDENMEKSLELAYKLMLTPNIEDTTWDETKKIILSERDDEQKDPRALSNALAHFHRYGSESRYLKRASDADLNTSSVSSLSKILSEIFEVERTILYYGPRTVERFLPLSKMVFLESNPPRKPILCSRPINFPKHKSGLFSAKEMAQAQVRLEFAAGTYDEAKAPLGQLFNEYFGGGMAGLVFQELREARACLLRLGTFLYSIKTCR